MKKEKFIQYVKENLFDKINEEEVDNDVIIFWKALCSSDTKQSNNKKLTDKGRVILEFLNKNEIGFKAKEISEAIGLSARSVAGSMQKLVNDEYVEKLGTSPFIYLITETGKEIIEGECDNEENIN